MKRAIDLGCGSVPKNPFGADVVLGIDLTSTSTDVIARELGYENIPFPDDHFDYCTAFDLLEHIPRTGGPKDNRNPFLSLMNEIWRVLKPNGLFHAKTPAYPATTAFTDPTHVNYITQHTAKYFGLTVTSTGVATPNPEYYLCRRYGFKGAFAILENTSDEQYGHQTWLFQKLTI